MTSVCAETAQRLQHGAGLPQGIKSVRSFHGHHQRTGTSMQGR